MMASDDSNTSQKKTKGDIDRRLFLLEVVKKTGQIAMATGAIYTVTLATSKNGNNAGAK